MLVARRSGGRPYCVVVAPAPAPPFGVAADHVAAIVLITDPDAAAAARHDLLRRLYHLTGKEAELAVRISEGQNLEAAAREGGITYQTARTYLKTVFAKLGVSRQAELAGVLQKLTAEG